MQFHNKDFRHTECKDISSFNSVVSNGGANNLRRLDVELILNYGRGTGDNISDHENSFVIKFEPYEITFVRKSNFQDSQMDEIENNIIVLLNQFSVENTIFCTK